jgi:hypothetical protein
VNGPQRGSRARQAISFGVGILLVLAAAWVVAGQRDVVGRAWSSARAAPPSLVVAALALPLINLLIVSTSFWMLMRRHGAISWSEMSCLIGAAWLLNFAPLRPGLVGRVAYHRTVNGVPVSRSIWVTVVGMGASAGAVLTVLLAAVSMRRHAGTQAWTMALISPVVVGGATTFSLWLWSRRSSAPLASAMLQEPIAAEAEPNGRSGAMDWWRPGWTPPWLLGATYVLRYLDVLVWVVRYAVVFALIGSPIGLAGAVAVAAVSQVTLIVPLVGNGLGLREWAVGLTAASLPAWAMTGPHGEAVGLTADLVNRGMEVMLAIPVGLASTAWLMRRSRAALRVSPAQSAVQG